MDSKRQETPTKAQRLALGTSFPSGMLLGLILVLFSAVSVAADTPLQEGNHFFIRQGGQFLYLDGSSIRFGPVEPEAFEFTPSSGSNYRITYRHHDLMWNRAPNYGNALYANGGSLYVGSNNAAWTLTHQGGNSYRATQGGFSATWELVPARDKKHIQLRANEQPSNLEGLKVVGYDEVFEEVYFGDIAGQKPYVNLKIASTIARYGNNQKYMTLNISDSEITPNAENVNIDSDTTKKRQWYLDYVEVFIDVKEKGGNGRRLRVSEQGPDSYSGSGSIGYSKSTSLGASFGASLGFEGKSPVSSVGGEVSMGISWGSSYSTELEDFGVTHAGTQTKIKHEYQMARTASSRRYRESKNLIWKRSPSEDHILDALPPRAKGNFPVITQGIFVGGRDLAEAEVTVTVRFSLQSVELRPPSWEWGYANYEIERTFDVDFGRL